MNISTFDHYRDLIKFLSKREHLTFRQICQKTNIHSSYFSRVMNDRADFSKEQLFLIGEIFQLSGWELDFFLLLGERDSSSVKGHADYLDQKVKAIKNEKQTVLSNLKGITQTMSEKEKEDYYKNPWTALVLMYLTIEKYRKKPKLMAKALHTDFSVIEKQLRTLIKLGLIQKKGEDFEVIKKSIHIDETHKMHRPNLINWRLQAIHYLQQGQAKESDWQFSTLFSTTEEKKKKIRDLFKTFVVEAQKMVGPESPESEVKVFYMNFDLY